MEIKYQDTVGLVQGGQHVPAGMTAMRFLFALMATRGAATALPRRVHYGPKR